MPIVKLPTEDNFCIWPLAAAALPALPRIARAQVYPVRQITMNSAISRRAGRSIRSRASLQGIKPSLGHNRLLKMWPVRMAVSVPAG